METETDTKEDAPIRVRRLEEHNRHLLERLTQEQQRSENLALRNSDLAASQRRIHGQLVSTRKTLKTAQADLTRIAEEKGVELLLHELDELRRENEVQRERLATWSEMARRLRGVIQGKLQRIHDLETVMHNLSDAVETANKQRGTLATTAARVVESMTDQRQRITEQCRLWQRGEQDSMTTLAGISAELNGHKLPEPGAWERKRHVREAEVRSQLMEAVDLEKSAKEALVRVLRVFGYKAPGLITMVQEGKYEEIIAGLETKQRERDEA